ncbi:MULTISPECIES: glycosyltransferase family 39 protein [Methanobacterium]|uniref:Uncharacterized protein n=1 Tax=Methanobacterium bryantii TaxID=2161 RepID=A0A2A2H1H1_METBR|nr:MULTISPECIES: glycosyltransferase family 39 protein [Methanobacterium]OEC86614.1 hypothetical protein A9507_10440 [Methanobacterium sp. A39]PAV03136.1 hypothetical protein ASJ80_07655 [Methanobacterium bryantii]
MFTKIKEKWWIITLFSIFVFSFILDMYVLTRYNLSYGMDGPFYDLQVLNILKTGLPASNDPPLVYYMLTPFVLISGNSFLGIKIGMALLGSLMAFPAFLLTEMFGEKIDIESKIPALLSAFLITVNIFYFQLIGDFMQNLVGVFFLLLLIYFAVKWLENPKEWKKYGILAITILLCNIFIHIYTGILAVILFISLLLFNWILISYKTGKVEMKGLKILGIVSILVIGGLAILFAVYPYMFSKFTTVLSFLNNSSTNSSNLTGGNFVNPVIFLTVPFILGVLVTIYIFYNGLKEKINVERKVISRKTLLAWAYLVLTVILISLTVAPSVDSQYKSRFIELAFVPIALMVPLGLKFIENWLSKIYPSKRRLKLGLISLIAVIFVISSFYTVTGEFSSMGPSITSEQYNNLVSLKENLTSNNIDTNGIILVNDYHTGYWVEYVLGMQVETGNLSEIQKEYPNRTIYAVTLTQNGQSQLKGNSEYLWNPLLPYSFPFVGWNFDNSFNSTGGQKQLSQNMSPPGDLGNATGQNRSGTPPNGLGSNRQNDKSSTFNDTGTGPNSAASGVNGPVNGGSSGGMSDQNLNRIISDYGTLIFSGSNFKIYKIS